MAPRLSERILETSPSPIRCLAPLALAARERGVDVYHLNIGQPDLPTPAAFFEAVRTFAENVLAYAPSEGIPELIGAIRDYYGTSGCSVASEEILVMNGGSEAILFALLTCCNPGDEVLVMEPFYTNYSTFAKAASVRLVPVETGPETGFRLPDEATIRSRITDRTKALLVTSPNNPTGVVLRAEEMDRLVRIGRDRGLFLISDEGYREFCYDRPFRSLLDDPDPIVRELVVVCDSISKRFSACGARIGHLVSRNLDFIRNVHKLCQGRLCAPTMDQVGAAALYRAPRSILTSYGERFRGRRDVFCDALARVPRVSFVRPEGAFYLMARLPLEDASDFAAFCLRDFSHRGETIMVAPGEGFYATSGRGRDEVRLAYVLEEDRLLRATELLALALEAYPGTRRG
jgi:aspartate aminotransferase